MPSNVVRASAEGRTGLIRVAGRIGWYGCGRGPEPARLVRVGQKEPGKTPPTRSGVLLCPHCEEEHRVNPTWRIPHEGELGSFDAEVRL